MAKYSEGVKQGIMVEIAGMRAANQIISVSGKRFDILAVNRDINVVY